MSFISNYFNSIKNLVTKAPETAIVPAKISLLELPEELLLQIFQQVAKSAKPVKELLNSMRSISKVCTTFYRICKDALVKNEVMRSLKTFSYAQVCGKSKEFIAKWQWKKENPILGQFLSNLPSDFFAQYEELSKADPAIRKKWEELNTRSNTAAIKYGCSDWHVFPEVFQKQFNPENNLSDEKICENVIEYWKKYLHSKE